MSESVEGKKPVSRSERIRAWLFLLVVGGPIVYGVSWFLLSPYFNRVFHYEKQCTIEWAAAGESRSKSYSGNPYIYVQTSDCGGLRFKGDRHGLTRAEVAERIDALAGQRVAVDVGVWQTPFAATDVVGFEGLDLGR